MGTSISDPREKYISLISLDKSHVDLSVPVVFLFGGAIKNSSDLHPSKSVWKTAYNHILTLLGRPIKKSPKSAKSVRGILFDYIKTNHKKLSASFVMPENFPDWLHDSMYPDLVTFESDLAKTSSLVVIALESPGAIAELGAFSVNHALKNKVIIIINAEHHEQDSFITLGPLRLLPEENIFAYPFDHASVEDTLNEYLEDIVLDINTSLDRLKKTEKFDSKNNGHIALFIFELVLLFKALKLNEIRGFLKTLSINFNSNEIKQLLFLLDKLTMVKKVRYGNKWYYIPLQIESRINISSKDKSELFDRKSVALGTAQYYAFSKDEEVRRKVIAKSAKRIKTA